MHIFSREYILTVKSFLVRIRAAGFNADHYVLCTHRTFVCSISFS